MDPWPEDPAPLWSLTTIPSLMYFSGDILNALANVSGRKHPSTVQGKQLKMCLPMMSVVLHLVMSQVTCYPHACLPEQSHLPCDQTFPFICLGLNLLLALEI